MGLFDMSDDPQKQALLAMGFGLLTPTDTRMNTLGQIGRAGLLGMHTYAGAKAQQRQDQKDELATLATTYKLLQDQDSQARVDALFNGGSYTPNPLLAQHETRLGKLLNLPGPNANAPSTGILGSPAPTPTGLLGNAPNPPSFLASGSNPDQTRAPMGASAPQSPQLPFNGQAPQAPQLPIQQPQSNRTPTMPELLQGAGIDPRVAGMVARTPEGQRTILNKLAEAYGPRVVNNVLMQYSPNGGAKFLGGVVSQDALPVTSDANGSLQGQPIPGSTDYFANRAGAITSAQEGARARNDLVSLPQPDGTVRYVTRAQGVTMTGQGGGNQQPIPDNAQPSNRTQATPGNPLGYGPATQVTPDVQHARDVQRVRILLEEQNQQLKQYGETDPNLEKELAAARASTEQSRNAKLPPWKQAQSADYQGAADAQPQRMGFAAGQSTAQRTAAEVNPKLQLETLQKSYDDTLKANDSLQYIDVARKAVNNGTTAGILANPALMAARVGTAFGITDPKYASNPQVFMAMAGRQTMSVIKNLGSGSGISDADREYAAKAMGGDIRLDKDSINRLLDINERAVKRSVELHNTRVDQASASGVPSVFDYHIQPFSGASTSVTAPNGRVYNFPTPDAAQRFKQQIGAR
jgi:hypothetical protein